jgi:Type II secretory pathway, pseudopilin PulG
LVELLVVIAIIAILSSILLPALAKAKARAHGVYSVNNSRQLTVAVVLYADDHRGTLPYNLDFTRSSPGDMSKNWVNNVLNWELSPDNTNSQAMLDSGIGPYTGDSAAIYRCPGDYAIGPVQSAAGWEKRVRSYSMNAMLGNVGVATESGENINNPGYRQFFKIDSIPRPSDIAAFVEEHPDSINDGYFINSYTSESAKKYSTPVWMSLPASDHDGMGVVSFSDGHSELHRWRGKSMKVPSRAYAIGSNGAGRPLKVERDSYQDFLWLISTMSIESRPEYSYH